MDYEPFAPEKRLRVKCLYSFHYFPFARGYVFPGEKHDFWELVYADSGETDIGADGKRIRLPSGHVILHAPGEFHSIFAAYEDAPNLMVVSFACDSPPMKKLRGFTRAVEKDEKETLSLLMDEGQAIFGPLLEDNDLLCALKGAPPYGAQMLVTLLERLLLLFLRRGVSERAPSPPALSGRAREKEEIIAFMRAHLKDNLSFEDILAHCDLSRSVLKELFRERGGVMKTYRELKLTQARRLLRSKESSVTRTAEILGYSSVHAFSRQFKQALQVSPGEYARSVKS